MHGSGSFYAGPATEVALTSHIFRSSLLPFVMLKARRRKKLFNQPLPAAWQRIVPAYCPSYEHLSAPDRRELDGHLQIFLAEKNFEGCAGLALTDEMRLGIAANACLLLLHRQTDYYPTSEPSSYIPPAMSPPSHVISAMAS